ncbi:uncharacterized protein LOC141891660 isoform X2 [Acropora palmata]|uniref:uncharacterized protein LOC141891660 isoform X2 n=1 Tax=Acropora palmata TaxID=6131 RepID=UPI003DA148DD
MLQGITTNVRKNFLHFWSTLLCFPKPFSFLEISTSMLMLQMMLTFNPPLHTKTVASTSSLGSVTATGPSGPGVNVMITPTPWLNSTVAPLPGHSIPSQLDAVSQYPPVNFCHVTQGQHPYQPPTPMPTMQGTVTSLARPRNVAAASSRSLSTVTVHPQNSSSSTCVRVSQESSAYGYSTQNAYHNGKPGSRFPVASQDIVFDCKSACCHRDGPKMDGCPCKTARRCCTDACSCNKRGKRCKNREEAATVAFQGLQFVQGPPRQLADGLTEEQGRDEQNRRVKFYPSRPRPSQQAMLTAARTSNFYPSAYPWLNYVRTTRQLFQLPDQCQVQWTVTHQQRRPGPRPSAYPQSPMQPSPPQYMFQQPLRPERQPFP